MGGEEALALKGAQTGQTRQEDGVVAVLTQLEKAFEAVLQVFAGVHGVPPARDDSKRPGGPRYRIQDTG